ncbi:hypothetical protein Zmor_000004 [Zophobas morio]|uniref:Gustatory receptor n=1 Tax=Zophobas morio TaxID=2755281 RepID=A0AA38IWR9_9CUCU|nr:hypothetical protein Zmor_000004 [Zophobas morio]
MTRENHTLFLILFKLWKYTGLPVYELQHENFVNVKSRNIYAAVLFLVASFYISLKQIYKENKRVIFDDITCTELIVLGLQNVTILIVSYNKRHDILRILLEIQLSEKLVAEISNKSQTSSNRKKLILGIAILKYGMLFTMLIIDLLNLPKQRINTLVHTMNLGFHYHFELVIFVYLISLVNQYRELNEHVKLNGKTERLQIIEVIKAHATLNYNFALTKKCFEGLILLKSVCDAFITTVGVYYFIQTLLQPGHLVLGSSAVLFFCLTLLVNFLGAVFFQNIFEQVSDV